MSAVARFVRPDSRDSDLSITSDPGRPAPNGDTPHPVPAEESLERPDTRCEHRMSASDVGLGEVHRER